ncbi:HAMP domain-containing histidine kinase [Archangium violaceum]|uniref:GAF domain-containing sensor histidine kinase n=1 Tax=Archangium violaceum TaxID=83451 RepID=UPI0019522D8C|nr:HAMP domain-containing sensor histidine kinase [Archangium violaceum]QRN93432.1 HAMP domain-containing histidine kinase [Archangium violaceum]
MSDRAEIAGVSFQDALLLLEAVRSLSQAPDVHTVARRVCTQVKQLLGSDGVSFVLCDGEYVYYAEEEAPTPLWKGRRFPATECISGWAILHRRTAVIEDVYVDSRIPIEAYRPTFVKSLAMMPIGHERPLGAIGAYWARTHKATERELFLLGVIADAAQNALSQVELRQEVARLQSRSTPGAGSRDVAGDPMLARLLPVIAHDLKNPLGAISLAAQSLSRRGSLRDGDVVSVRRILSSVERARHLVDEILEYARVREQGGLPLDIAETRLDDVARTVIDEARTVFPNRDIEFVAEQVCGAWDAHRLAEVFSNLLGNALQYGHPESPVTLHVSAHQGECHLEVHNTGPAIPPDVLPVLFEPFRRGRSDGRGSVGLGLFIVSQIVQAHGGRIEVQSTPAHGTTFTVHLPTRQSLPIELHSA